jgi:hypothetical protein
MKILKIILFVLVGVVALVFLAALIAPKTYFVERSTTIDAPQPLVMNHVKKFEHFQQWSPWSQRDTTMRTTIEGEDGMVGATYAWSGNKDVGSGSMRITEVTDDSVGIQLSFIEPFESQSDNYYLVRQTPEGTKVVWGMAGADKVPLNLISRIMNVEEMIGNDFDKGLAALKQQVERAREESASGYRVERIELPQRHYLTKRATIPMSELDKAYGDMLGATMGAMLAQNVQPSGAPSAIYYTWDEAKGESDMAAAVPVPEGTSLEGFEVVPVEGKAIMLKYSGAYDKMEEAHMVLSQYMEENNLEYRDIVLEEYLTDPTTERDTTLWKTNIYYLIQ